MADLHAAPSLMPVKKIIATPHRPLLRYPLHRVRPDRSAEQSPAQGGLEAAYFLTIGSGLFGWWVEESRELLTGLGCGFALAVIITAIDLHYRKWRPARLNPTFRGIHNLLRKRASINYRV